MSTYKVKQGDCLSSIAFSFGLAWRTIWNHENNAALRDLRKDPNVLLPGDLLYIPDKDAAAIARATGARHRFRRKDVPAKLKLRLLADGKPRAGQSYSLYISGLPIIHGAFDGDGCLEHPIPPDAKWAELRLSGKNNVFHLLLGKLDPISTVTGVQARLNALGYNAGDVDGDTGDALAAALRSFQLDNNLDPSGKIDQPTRDKLTSLYGS
jgi:N-acetylmuramoyl-L-alanine amidase